jgi:hypothetical protein
MEVNMSSRGIAGFVAAAFFVSTAAFAQSQSQTSADREKNVSSTNATMTLVGCLIHESDYRKAHGLGKGALGGVGLGDEFVLVDATEVPATNATAAPSAGESPSRPASSSSPACAETGNGKAYRMTGKAEDQLKPFVGHRMQITGQFDHERDAKTAAGETNAKLPPEIKIASYREAPASIAQAPATARTTPAPSAPPAASVPSQPSSQPSQVASNQTPTERRLPNTASNEPLIALIGMICLSVAFGVHVLRARTS